MSLYGVCFDLAVALGRPFGGLRPRRMYHWLARRAFSRPEFKWISDRWGCQFFLSPYYALDREIIAFGTYEQSIQKFIRGFLKPGMGALDIGANIGVVALPMARLVGTSGKVAAFEPAPVVLERLRSHVKKNALEEIVTIFDIALSDRNGTAEFAFADESKENQGMGSLVSRSNLVVTKTATVQIRRLDDMIGDLNFSRSDLIKMDAQGAELSILRGATEFLRRYKPALLTEVSPLELASAGTNPKDLLGFIESVGYEIFALEDGRLNRRFGAKEISNEFEADAICCLHRDSQSKK